MSVCLLMGGTMVGMGTVLLTALCVVLVLALFKQ